MLISPHACFFSHNMKIHLIPCLLSFMLSFDLKKSSLDFCVEILVCDGLLFFFLVYMLVKLLLPRAIFLVTAASSMLFLWSNTICLSRIFLKKKQCQTGETCSWHRLTLCWSICLSLSLVWVSNLNGV